ncbi:MAG TPA: GxxExxY protein [Vicinamibacterales bacterium]|nr:GxxExxY protein [Vicinamibacterales bacterium]
MLWNTLVTVQRSALAGRVIGCAIEVHQQIGPGLLESAYDSCLTHEFTLNGIGFCRDVAVPILYKGTTVSCAHRADFVVENELLVELKSVERLQPIHQAQVLTYMRLLSLRQGLLINFNVHRLVDGLRSLLL